MIKASFFEAESAAGPVAIPLFGPADPFFEKAASPRLLPDVVKYIERLRPQNDAQYVLLNAMGAGEYWGSNINGDYFSEASLIHAPDDWTGKPLLDKIKAKTWPYGFPTFYEAHPYAHHKNKDPSRAYGEVELALWNPSMHRVELVTRVDKDKCEKFGGVGVWDKLKAGLYPDVSMGCKVPFDTCSICLDWDTYHKAEATFDSTRQKHPGEAVLARHKALKLHNGYGIRGVSITRVDYCDHAKKMMNKILPDGRKVFVYNDYPKFFDISFVFIGADKTAKVMMKLAGEGRTYSFWNGAELAEKLGYVEEDEEKTAAKKDIYVYSYVPKNSLPLIKEHGLHSGQSLINNPELLAAAAASRKISSGEMRADIEKNLAGWGRYSSMGPNVAFALIPPTTSLPDNHPTKKFDLEPIKINLSALLRDEPKTKVYGMELVPYPDYVKVKGKKPARHRYLSQEEVHTYAGMSAEDLWSKFNDIDGKGFYAADVPHGSVHTPSGHIPGRYVASALGSSSTSKTASVQDEVLKVAFGKLAKNKSSEMTKDVVPSQFAGKAVPMLTHREPELPDDVLDMLGSVSSAKALATPTGLGMLLRPREFQRIILIQMGMRPTADQLDREGKVFPKVDAEEKMPMDAGSFQPALARLLLPFMAARSLLGPLIERRVVVLGASAPEKKGSASSHPSALLHKIGAAYNGYRRSAMDLVANAQDLLLSTAGSSNGSLLKIASAPVTEVFTPLSIAYLEKAYWDEVGHEKSSAA